MSCSENEVTSNLTFSSLFRVLNLVPPRVGRAGFASLVGGPVAIDLSLDPQGIARVRTLSYYKSQPIYSTDRSGRQKYMATVRTLSSLCPCIVSCHRKKVGTCSGSCAARDVGVFVGETCFVAVHTYHDLSLHRDAEEDDEIHY